MRNIIKLIIALLISHFDYGTCQSNDFLMQLINNQQREIIQIKTELTSLRTCLRLQHDLTCPAVDFSISPSDTQTFVGLGTPDNRVPPTSSTNNDIRRNWHNLVIIGGTPNNDVQVFDMRTKTERTCSKPSNFPYEVVGSFGLINQGRMMICGGHYNSREAGCHEYYPDIDTWVLTTSMNEARLYASVVPFGNDGSYWITGGNYIDDDFRESTTEIFTPGLGFREGGKLPEAKEGHCMVMINETHYFFAGGKPLDSLTWIYDSSNNNWIEQSRMAEPRIGAHCSLQEWGDGSREIIISGGYNMVRNITVSEIYDLNTGTWRQGEDIGVPCYEGASVTYQDSFLSIGGSMNEDFIHVMGYDPETSQFTDYNLPVQGRVGFVAFVLPDEMLQC